MENFQLREGSSRRSPIAFRNLPNNTCRSFISTALASESILSDDLRKSRIQNLPNYKRTSLGDNINFIVVFQTIQIERLSQQVQLLRVKLKQNERQLFNAQNYQVQIRQLTEKCFNLEQKIELYKEEIQKLNRIAENLYNENQQIKQKMEEMDDAFELNYQGEKKKGQDLQQELEKWKNRVQMAERSKVKEMDELKNMMEAQRKSTVDREIRQLSTRFQNQKSGLQNQIRKHKQTVANKNYQNQQLKTKIYKLQGSLQDVRRYEQALNESQSKLALMTGELAKSNDQLEAKEQQLFAVNKNIAKCQQQLREQGQCKEDVKYLKDLLESKVKEIELQKSKSNQYQSELMRGKEIVHFVNQLQGKLDLATNQINRVTNLLKSKMEQNQKIKNKLQTTNNQISKYRHLENEMAQYDSKFNMIKAENERINGILKFRLDQIQVWKNKYAELQTVATRYALLERDKKILEEKYNQQLKTGQQYKFYIGKLETENSQINYFKNTLRESQNKAEMLLKELDRLNMIIKNHSEDMTESRVKYQKLEESLNQFKQKAQFAKEYQNKLKLISEQNKSLNNLISNKNRDIEQLQNNQIDMLTKINKYKTYESKVSEYQNTVKMLNEDINQLKRQIEGWQNKARQSDSKCRQVENAFIGVQHEKDRLNNVYKSKNSQIDEIKKKNMFLEQQNRKKAELDIVCQELHGQVLVYLGELQITEKRCKQIEEAYGKERSKNQQMFNKMMEMKNQNQKKNRQMNSGQMYKTKEIQDLQRKVKTYLEKVKEKDNQISILLQKIEKVQKQCCKLLGNYQKMLITVQQNQKQTKALNLKIEQYKDYAKRIHILDAELDRLTAVNRNLQDDNKTMRLKYSDNINFQKKQQSIALITVLMSAQIESLRTRLEQREVKMDQMRRSILQPIRKI